jgi:hypothetical protein
MMEYKAVIFWLNQFKKYSNLKKIIAEFAPQNHLKIIFPPAIIISPFLTFVRRQEYSPGILMKKGKIFVRSEQRAKRNSNNFWVRK